MSEQPKANGDANGRQPGGRFGSGNQAAAGRAHPHARVAAQHRAEFWQSIRTSDVKLAVATIRKVLKSKKAKDSDKLAAARELLNRVVGVSIASDMLERIESLEQQRDQQQNGERDSGN